MLLRSPATTIGFISGQGSLAMNAMGEFTYTPPTGDFEFFFGVSPNRAKRAIAAGETGTIQATYRIVDMGSPAETATGVLTITVTAPPAAVAQHPADIEGGGQPRHSRHGGRRRQRHGWRQLHSDGYGADWRQCRHGSTLR